ncbi:hypothetical protein mRhiFer1_010206 [Rhinolophus ferrumequinum]|uniref:Uncharacterized protein n=1 Tax=Rhinolophus ferrumequinum TaxID=59479 RepID=A0A7J7X5K0_RHIFE|nr:hypothetical protein mRhiFer1_010206 [Rhinolophus ferrumequinum]
MSARAGYAVAACPLELRRRGPGKALSPQARPSSGPRGQWGGNQTRCAPFTSSWASLGSSPGGRGGGPPATSILGVQLHSAGPQARDLHPVGAAAAQMVPEGRKGIHPAGCRLPVCDTHYRNDCVFSLITHYFYAERRLNEGKKKKQQQ